VTDLESQIGRLQNIGGSRLVQDGPGGRVFSRRGREDEEKRAVDNEPRYDVVTIGGYSFTVAGVDEGYGAGVETVNGYFGEKNHIFGEGLTRAQVQDMSWSWGRGNAQTYFALAAILHGTRDQIPDWEGGWWNTMIPSSILAARSIGGKTGGAVTLTLTIGVLG